jgi:hypothetical protein
MSCAHRSAVVDRGATEARPRLQGTNPVTPVDRARLQFIAAVCNGMACSTLRAAVDFIEARSLEQLEQESDFLHGLTALEQEEERRLTQEFAEYRQMIDARLSKVDGGFDKSWTFWAGRGGDREAAGIGAA